MFLKNAWYVAGWSKDFGRELKAETFLGENLVIYRKEDGAPVHFEPLPDASAKGVAPTGGETPPAPSSNPHMTLLLALVALPLVALVLGVLLFWIL